MARQASIRRNGSSPEPARMPSLPAIPSLRLRLDEAARGFLADEAQHVFDGAHAGITLRHMLDALGESAVLALEQHLVSAAQGLDLVAREAAALHADNVEAAQARPIAQHRAIGDDVALDPGDAADHR